MKDDFVLVAHGAELPMAATNWNEAIGETITYLRIMHKNHHTFTFGLTTRRHQPIIDPYGNVYLIRKNHI